MYVYKTIYSPKLAVTSQVQDNENMGFCGSIPSLICMYDVLLYTVFSGKMLTALGWIRSIEKL